MCNIAHLLAIVYVGILINLLSAVLLYIADTERSMQLNSIMAQVRQKSFNLLNRDEVAAVERHMERVSGQVSKSI